MIPNMSVFYLLPRQLQQCSPKSLGVWPKLLIILSLNLLLFCKHWWAPLSWWGTLPIASHIVNMMGEWGGRMRPIPCFITCEDCGRHLGQTQSQFISIWNPLSARCDASRRNSIAISWLMIDISTKIQTSLPTNLSLLCSRGTVYFTTLAFTLFRFNSGA